MIALMAAPFVVAVVLALGATYLASHMPPAAATRVLCSAALTVSLTCGLMLCGAAVLGISQLAPIAAVGHWSTTMPGNEIRPVAGVVAALIAISLFASGAVRAFAALRVACQARAVALALPAPVSKLVVVDDQAPIAYALAGAGGRIVVSSAMLRALASDERRVLLAHEVAHLRYRHHLYVAITDVAAAANPFLRPVAQAVCRSVERWADEVAAAEVGDRRVAARSVAHAALVRARFRGAGFPSSVTPGALGLDDGDVPARVRALLAPPSGRQVRLRVAILCASALCWFAGAVVTVWTHAVLELAQSLAGH
jgi:Zn-dependent protease with chaperone function